MAVEGVVISVLLAAGQKLLAELNVMRTIKKSNPTIVGDIEAFTESLKADLNLVQEKLKSRTNDQTWAIESLEEDLEESSKQLQNWRRQGLVQRYWDAKKTRAELSALREKLSHNFQVKLTITSIEVLIDKENRTDEVHSTLLQLLTATASRSDVYNSTNEIKNLLKPLTSRRWGEREMFQQVRADIKELAAAFECTNDNSLKTQKFLDDILGALATDAATALPYQTEDDAATALPQQTEDETDYCDPFTYELMCDPVKCADGLTYDRFSVFRNNTEIPSKPLFILCDDLNVRRRLFEKFHHKGLDKLMWSKRNSYKMKALEVAKAGQFGEALVSLDNVLQWAPKDSECLQMREKLRSSYRNDALKLAENGQHAEARIMLEKVLKWSPSDLECLTTYKTIEQWVATEVVVGQEEIVSTAENQPVDAPETGKVTWRVEHFSRADVRELYSDSSVVGGYSFAELENRLLAKFDAASQRREFSTMAECAKILSQFNRGANAMQRYVASRPMFMGVEIMETDAQTVLGDTSNVAKGLNMLYKQILDTVQTEAAVVASFFPSPDAVMCILVQRILEQRVFMVMDRVLVKPSLTSPTPMEAGGILQYLRTLSTCVEKTQDLAKELETLGCGDLDAQGLAENLFSSHRDEYPELEQASLGQLYQLKKAELRSSAASEVDGIPASAPRDHRSPSSYGQIVMSVGVVAEFVRWNDEAVQRCTLVTPQPIPLATNVRAIFSCLLEQVSEYTTEGLRREQETLNEATLQRKRFTVGSNVSRRVQAAAAAAAEAAAHAGEGIVRTFMVAVNRATSNVALVQQYFVNTISPLLLPVDGAHAACREEMGNAMASSESAALKGLQDCINNIVAEAERLLAEQKVTDYRPVDDGNPPDHRPTSACSRVVRYLARMLEAVQGALEGLNKQTFMTELGNRLHRALITHWQRFHFSASGGLKLKCDVSEYADFVRNFKAPVVDEKFEQLGTLVNVFIVAPESLPNLVDRSLKLTRKDAIRFIQLREDYKSAKIGSRFSALNF